MALGERGVADIVAMAIMFILVVFAGMAMHFVTTQPLVAAADRQLALRGEYLYRALESADVGPYAISYLEAAAENLLLKEPTVPGDYLRSSMENVLTYAKPEGYSVRVRLTYGENVWELTVPLTAGEPRQGATYWGTISIVRAEAPEGERVLGVRAEVALWR